jgi:hypothetical protein
MTRHLLILQPSGLHKRESANGATDDMCFDFDGDACNHFVDGKKGESCSLFGEWFDGSDDNARLPACLEAERLAKESGQ